jgi:hypothetical protein
MIMLSIQRTQEMNSNNKLKSISSLRIINSLRTGLISYIHFPSNSNRMTKCFNNYKIKKKKRIPSVERILERVFRM